MATIEMSTVLDQERIAVERMTANQLISYGRTLIHLGYERILCLAGTWVSAGIRMRLLPGKVTVNVGDIRTYFSFSSFFITKGFGTC